MKIRQPKPTSLVDAAPSLKAMPRPSMDHVLLDAICRTRFRELHSQVLSFASARFLVSYELAHSRIGASS